MPELTSTLHTFSVPYRPGVDSDDLGDDYYRNLNYYEYYYTVIIILNGTMVVVISIAAEINYDYYSIFHDK